MRDPDREQLERVLALLSDVLGPNEEERWDDVRQQVRRYADHVVREIHRLSAASEPPRS